MDKNVETLMNFLNMPLNNSIQVFNKFLKLPHAKLIKKDKYRAVFIPGTRNDKVLLIAHADTVWETRKNTIYFDKAKGIISSKFSHDYALDKYQAIKDVMYSNTPYKCGIGADDRAGIAMLWLLRNSGHSILITADEEKGAPTARVLGLDHDFRQIVNSHNFVVELDKRGYKEFKNYNVGTNEFKKYLMDTLNYNFVDGVSFTDINFLCKDICGVNFGIGYYNEHTYLEYIDVSEWLDTLSTINSFLKQELPRFELPKTDENSQTSFEDMSNYFTVDDETM